MDRGSRGMSIPAKIGCVPQVPNAWVKRPRSTAAGVPSDMAERINGLFKAALSHCRGPWRSCEGVEYAILGRVDWVSDRRPLEPM